MLVRAYTRVNPTESREKVEKALKNIVSKGKIRCFRKGDVDVLEIEGYGEESLETIFYKIRQKKIVDSFRKLLRRNRGGNETVIMLNKQSAYVGVITVCETEKESPLGPVFLQIKSQNQKIEEIIDWLAPETKA